MGIAFSPLVQTLSPSAARLKSDAVWNMGVQSGTAWNMWNMIDPLFALCSMKEDGTISSSRQTKQNTIFFPLQIIPGDIEKIGEIKLSVHCTSYRGEKNIYFLN